MCFRPGVIFLFITCLLTSSYAEALGHSDSFSLYVESQAVHPRLKSYIAVEAGSFNRLDEIPNVLKSMKAPNGSAVLPLPGHPLKVIVVVPKDAPPAYLNAYAAKVKHILRDTLGPTSAQVTCQYSYIDSKKEEAEFLQEAAYLRSELPQDGSKNRFIKARLEDIKQNVQSLRAWRLSWFTGNPTTRTIAAYAVSLLQGVISFSIIISKYGLFLHSGLGPAHVNWWGLLSAGLSAAPTAFFSMIAPEFSRWATHHMFPLSRRVSWLEKNFAVRYYNSSPISRSITVNFIRTSVSAYVTRLAAYLGRLRDVRSGRLIGNPNKFSFFSESAGLTGLTVVTDSQLNIALRSLSQKGRLSYAAWSYIIWGISIIDTMMDAFFRRGDVVLAYSIGLANAGLRLVIRIISVVLPRQAPRIVIISDLITRNNKKRFGKTDLEYVVLRNGLDEAWKLSLSGEQLEQLKKPTTSLEKISGILNLGDLPTPEVNKIARLMREENKSPKEACATVLSSFIPQVAYQ